MYAAHNINDHDALLTEVHAADILKLSIRTLQAWRARRTGPSYVRAGRAIRYRKRDLLAWMDANTISAACLSATMGRNAS
jgi:hypothetical protein